MTFDGIITTNEDQFTIIQMQDLLEGDRNDLSQTEEARTLWKNNVLYRRKNIQKMTINDVLSKYPGYRMPIFVSIRSLYFSLLD